MNYKILKKTWLNSIKYREDYSIKLNKHVYFIHIPKTSGSSLVAN